MLIKAGVDISRLKPEIRKKLNKIESIISAILGEEMIVTSTYEGTHSPGSLHYADWAVDIRSINKRSAVWGEIKRYLGDDYDVCLESKHIHIEYDPPI